MNDDSKKHTMWPRTVKKPERLLASLQKTAAEIRQMDGPELMLLAFHLHLCPFTPAEHQLEIDAILGEISFCANGIDFETWDPHVDLCHAHQVLQILRTHGWDTHVQYFAESATGQVGCWKRPEPLKPMEGFLVQWHAGENEATAILRCACLAANYQPPP